MMLSQDCLARVAGSAKFCWLKDQHVDVSDIRSYKTCCVLRLGRSQMPCRICVGYTSVIFPIDLLGLLRWHCSDLPWSSNVKLSLLDCGLFNLGQQEPEVPRVRAIWLFFFSRLISSLDTGCRRIPSRPPLHSVQIRNAQLAKLLENCCWTGWAKTTCSVGVVSARCTGPGGASGHAPCDPE